MAGFGYSDALMAMKGKPWTWDEMSSWLKSPKTYAPGTKMAFAGVAKPEDRAALLVFLNSKSDKPLPLPAVPAEAAAPAADAAAAPADAAAAPADAPAAEPAPAG
jgi:cytochrome c